MLRDFPSAQKGECVPLSLEYLFFQTHSPVRARKLKWDESDACLIKILPGYWYCREINLCHLDLIMLDKTMGLPLSVRPWTPGFP
jgi:hypothetical protein